MSPEEYAVESEIKTSKEPVSLESERRKGMIMIHYVERDTKTFRNKWLRNASDDKIEALLEFAEYARNKLGLKKPKNEIQFLSQQEMMMSDQDLTERHEISLIGVIAQRAKHFNETVRTCIDRLRKSVNVHISPYCLSFSPEMEGREVKCVHEYENNINKWQKEIENIFMRIEMTLEEYKNMGSPSFFEHVQNYGKILYIMSTTFDEISKMHEPIKKWVVADEAYASRVQFELNSILRRKMTISETLKRHNARVIDAKHKLIRSKFNTTKMHGQLQGVLTERRICRKRELSSQDDIEMLELDMEMKKRELSDALNRFQNRKVNSQSLYDYLQSKISSLQEDIYELENNTRKIKQKMLMLKKDRYHVQKEVHRLKTEYETSQNDTVRAHDLANTQNKSINELLEKQRNLAAKAKSLRRIRQIKLHPNTVKDIYFKGYTPGRKMSFSDPFEDAFRTAAGGIGREWVKLYRNLTFVPSRGYEARTHAIEIPVRKPLYTTGARGIPYFL